MSNLLLVLLLKTATIGSGFPLRQRRSKVGNVYISITLPHTFTKGFRFPSDGQDFQEQYTKLGTLALMIYQLNHQSRVNQNTNNSSVGDRPRGKGGDHSSRRAKKTYFLFLGEITRLAASFCNSCLVRIGFCLNQSSSSSRSK